MRKQSGFTLAELLIVVAIISVLVAISIPIFSSKLDRAREVTCLANRRSLYSMVCADYLSGDYPSLEAAFHGIYDNNKSEFPCPSGGTFSWVDDGDGKGHITCSVHDGSGGSGSSSGSSGGGSGSSGGGSEGTTYGDTDIKVHDNYWPKQSDYDSNIYGNITVPAGGIFQYTDGNYYIVVRDTSLTKSQAASGPGGEVYGWYNTEKMTGRIITYSDDNVQRSDLNRGDICQVGDDYYVFKDGGSYAYSPVSPHVSEGSWYKIPN
ncbi:MAG: type II secretion system protein [Clostridia bacterium]|nr:type II secretion system protein [Clostridia bacterium]